MTKLTRTRVLVIGVVAVLAASAVAFIPKARPTPVAFSQDLVVMLKYRSDAGERLAGLNDPRARSKILDEVAEHRKANHAGAPSRLEPKERLAAATRIGTAVGDLRRLLDENQRAVSEFKEGGGVRKENARNEMKRTSDALEPWTRLLWDYMNAGEDFESIAMIFNSGRLYAFLDRVESDARVMAEHAQWEMNQGGQRR